MATNNPLLVLVINTRCNQKCIYCPPMGEGHACIPSDLDIETAINVVHTAMDLGISNFRISGGEPSIHPQFEQYLELMRDIKRKNGYVSLNTNAVTLNKYIDKIDGSCIDLLRISLDSLDQASYRGITKTDMLTRVIHNIDLVNSKKIRIRINMVVMRSNIDEIENFINFCSSRCIELKLLDVEKHQFDKNRVWDNQFIPLSEIKKILYKSATESEQVLSWGGTGMPMSDYLISGVDVRVKDSLVSSTYTGFCVDSCDIYPCAEGVYDLLVLPENKIAWCRRKPNTYVEFNSKTLPIAMKDALKIVHCSQRIEHPQEDLQLHPVFGLSAFDFDTDKKGFFDLKGPHIYSGRDDY